MIVTWTCQSYGTGQGSAQHITPHTTKAKQLTDKQTGRLGKLPIIQPPRPLALPLTCTVKGADEVVTLGEAVWHVPQVRVHTVCIFNRAVTGSPNLLAFPSSSNRSTTARRNSSTSCIFTGFEGFTGSTDKGRDTTRDAGLRRSTCHGASLSHGAPLRHNHGLQLHQHERAPYTSAPAA